MPSVAVGAAAANQPAAGHGLNADSERTDGTGPQKNGWTRNDGRLVDGWVLGCAKNAGSRSITAAVVMYHPPPARDNLALIILS